MELKIASIVFFITLAGKSINKSLNVRYTTIYFLSSRLTTTATATAALLLFQINFNDAYGRVSLIIIYEN